MPKTTKAAPAEETSDSAASKAASAAKFLAEQRAELVTERAN